MNIKSLLQNTLYFIPVVGTIHHARESYKLNREYQELVKFAPSIKDMSGMNSILAQLRNAKAFKELDTLSVDLKMRASKYFAHKNEVDQFGFWGSIAQVIICLAAQALNPAFLVLGRVESLHTLYSLFKLVGGHDLYYYDSQRSASAVYRRDLFGESAIFGKKMVSSFDLEVELSQIIID